jgi:hypothetical protein
VEDGKHIQLNKATLLGGTLDIQGGASLLSSTFASTINLEGGAVTNAGTLEGAGAGLTVDGDVAKTGLVIAETGALTITGAITGMGRIEVFGKQTLEIDGAQGGTVGFGKGATGRLALGDSAAFSGSITGFSKTAANSIDLKDIVYGTGDTVTFRANKSAGSGGVLTVSDGTHIATIKLSGETIAARRSPWAPTAERGRSSPIRRRTPMPSSPPWRASRRLPPPWADRPTPPSQPRSSSPRRIIEARPAPALAPKP